MVPETVGDTTTLEAKMHPMAAGEDQTARHWFVTFRLNRQSYALPLDVVERALRMVAVAPVPEGPSWVLGGINLQGQVVPVIDLRRLFGQPAKDPGLHDRLLVVRPLGQTLALVVDEVSEVLEVPGFQVKPPPPPLSRSRILAAVIRRQSELILVLDPEMLLPSPAESKPAGSGMPGASDNSRPDKTVADR